MHKRLMKFLTEQKILFFTTHAIINLIDSIKNAVD